MPAWSGLPTETQAALTNLMTLTLLLILLYSGVPIGLSPKKRLIAGTTLRPVRQGPASFRATATLALQIVAQAIWFVCKNFNDNARVFDS